MVKTVSPRVLHSAALLKPSSGMVNQMKWEQDAAKELGLPWTVKMYCPLNSIIPDSVSKFDPAIDSIKITSSFKNIKAWLRLRISYHRWLISQQDEFDIFILRYYVHDPFQLWFVKKCNKPVYFVHHTLEVTELSLPANFSAFIRANLERFLGRWTLKHAAGLIGVTNEIVQYEVGRSKTINKPTHIYPNGIVFKKLNLVDRRKEEMPELLFVANFSSWHGLDILLNAVKNSKLIFILHLVGKIPDSLMNLTKDSRVYLHGELDQNQISRLSEQCWIGLSSFALKRNKMNEACPLKAREYLMLGLPVYGDYQDAFPNGVCFFKRGSADMREIIEFASTSRSFNKDRVASSAKKFIEKKKLLEQLYGSLRH